MHCPVCKHTKTRILRTKPDDEFPSRDIVRQCKQADCRAIFTTRESLVSVMEKDGQGEVLDGLLAQLTRLSPESVLKVKELLAALQ